MEVYHLLQDAWTNVKKLYPDFDPIKGHLSSDAPEGSSFFNEDIKSLSDLMLYHLFSDCRKEEYRCEVVPGRNGAINVLLYFQKVYGTHVVTKAITEENYKIVRNHGDLVTTGKAEIIMNPSKCITFCITPEFDKTGLVGFPKTRVYCLASVYPGFPDESEQDWSGINEGDQISGEELFRRNITRVKNLSNV